MQRRLGKGLKLGTEAACAIAVANHDANVNVRFDLRDFGQSSLIGLGVNTTMRRGLASASNSRTSRRWNRLVNMTSKLAAIPAESATRASRSTGVKRASLCC